MHHMRTTNEVAWAQSKHRCASQEHVGPAVIVDTPHVRCWHKLDDKFKLPKAIVHMEITSPSAYATPRACVLTRLFTELFKVRPRQLVWRTGMSMYIKLAYVLLQESLAEYSYIAEVAGLSYSLDNSVYGLVLTLMGYRYATPRMDLDGHTCVDSHLAFQP